ncbi:hypothetical protein AURDEDRAFT_171713 [Auricularia subglabra TFB-10046 SS5]|nr:hypothetical protein AURDEDRAFT_171713 [Auricularia subglabra TFB-10046 SS5]
MDPQQSMWDDILAYLVVVQAAGRNIIPNSAPPAHQTAHQQNSAGFSGNTGSASAHTAPHSASGVLLPASMASHGYMQAAHPRAMPQQAAFPTPTPTFAAHAAAMQQPIRRGQQPTAYRPPPPGIANPQQRPAYRRIIPAPSTAPTPASHQPLVRAPIVPSQGLPPFTGTTRTPLVNTAPVEAPQSHLSHAQWAPAQHLPLKQQLRLLQAHPGCVPPPARGQPMYAPPPGPPPGWRGPPPPPPLPITPLPPSRSRSASPWDAGIFTPSPVLSTPMTTPGSALTPSPAVGGLVPLPHDAHSTTPHAFTAGQHAPRGNVQGMQSAGPSQVVTSSRKRRISDAVDDDICESGPLKRAATHSALQARSTEINTIGHQVQLNNTFLPTQRAPSSPVRDAALAPEAPVTATTAAGGENEDAAAAEDAGSLFEGDEATDDNATEDTVTDDAANNTAAGEGSASDNGADDNATEGVAANDNAAEDVANDNATEEEVANDSAAEEEVTKDDAELLEELEAALSCPEPVTSEVAQASNPPPVVNPKQPAVSTSTQLALPEAGAPEHHKPTPAPFALCLPGTDPVPQGKVVRTGPRAHLPPSTSSTGNGSSWSVGAGSTNAEASGASSVPEAPVATPPLGNKGKKGRARKGTSNAVEPSTASGSSTARSSSGRADCDQQTQTQPATPPASDKDAKEAREAARKESERRVRINNAVLLQNPELPRYSWMTATTTVPTAAAPNLGSMEERAATVGQRAYLTTGPAPLKKPYWCKTCWKNRAANSRWFNARELEEHVTRMHRELLNTNVWRHEGM